jgi:hypothetical protein
MTRRIGVAVSTTLAAGVLAVAIALPASATPPPKGPPASGDNRATSYAGNVSTCAEANLAGAIIDQGKDLTVQYIDVTVPAGYELTGTVVKGGDGYNVYPPTALTDLRAPYNNGDQTPTISHWFACAIKKDTSSSTKPPTNPPSSSSGSSSSSAPAGGSSSSSSAPAAQGSVVSSAELADTGFSATAPLTGAGALILLGGGLLLALRRTRRRG